MHSSHYPFISLTAFASARRKSIEGRVGLNLFSSSGIETISDLLFEFLFYQAWIVRGLYVQRQSFLVKNNRLGNRVNKIGQLSVCFQEVSYLTLRVSRVLLNLCKCYGLINRKILCQNSFSDFFYKVVAYFVYQRMEPSLFFINILNLFKQASKIIFQIENL